MFIFVNIFVFQESLEKFFRTWDDIMVHKAVVKMALDLADHPQTLGEIICDRLTMHAARKHKLFMEDRLMEIFGKSSIHKMVRDFTDLTTDMAKTADFDICSNKHIRVIDNFTHITSFSASRIIVFRSLNIVMCQLDPSSIPIDADPQLKEWHIESKRAEDALLKVLHWFQQYEPVTVISLCSRNVVLKIVGHGIGTGKSSRQAECWFQASYSHDNLLNALNLIAEIQRQQNLEITITELYLYRIQIKDAAHKDDALTKLLLNTLKFGTNANVITVSSCKIPGLVSEHIIRQLPTCDKLKVINFNSSPCMASSLGNIDLIEFTSLKKLNLQRCHMTPQVADQLAQILPQCCNLMYLYLGYNKTAGLLEKLFGQHGVSKFLFVQRLNLQKTSLSKADLSSLSQAVSGGGLPKLQTLMLSDNVLANCLADLLGSNVYPIFANLEHLDLYRTSLNRDDLLRLSAAVKHCQFPKLNCLDLAENNLDFMEDAVTDLIKNCIEKYEKKPRLDLSLGVSYKVNKRMKSLCGQTNVVCHQHDCIRFRFVTV